MSKDYEPFTPNTTSKTYDAPDDADRVEHEGLPVHGYKKQSEDNVQLVNRMKIMEERVLRITDGLLSEGPDDVDYRWAEIGKDHIQQGFMALARSVFRPERLKTLPEDLVGGLSAPILSRARIMQGDDPLAIDEGELTKAPENDPPVDDEPETEASYKYTMYEDLDDDGPQIVFKGTLPRGGMAHCEGYIMFRPSKDDDVFPHEDDDFTMGSIVQDETSGITGRVVAVTFRDDGSSSVCIQRYGLNYEGNPWPEAWVDAAYVSPVEEEEITGPTTTH